MARGHRTARKLKTVKHQARHRHQSQAIRARRGGGTHPNGARAPRATFTIMIRRQAAPMRFPDLGGSRVLRAPGISRNKILSIATLASGRARAPVTTRTAAARRTPLDCPLACTAASSSQADIDLGGVGGEQKLRGSAARTAHEPRAPMLWPLMMMMILGPARSLANNNGNNNNNSARGLAKL